jgi:hypothetical protein
MSRHDFARDPCPWRLIEDMGGAYSMGLAGGAIWSSGKVHSYWHFNFKC